MAFFKNILNRLARVGEPPAADAADPDAPPAPAVRLAVFGKHPAWDDHIDDIGLDTGRLVAVKRAFYLQGVGANLDAGTWDKLGPDQRLPRFDHLFVWRAGASTVVGRAVASTDGKGRGRYPLVACAQCVGVPPDRLAGRVAPLLDEALARCGKTAVRDEVLAILADVRGRLQQVAAGPGSPPPAGAAAAPVPIAPLTPADLAACPDLGEGGVKLYTVYFQVEREMKAFAAPDGPPKVPAPRPGAGPGGAAAVHLRVPACSPSPARAAQVWIDLLATGLDPAAPVLAIAAVGHGWVDLLVGDPGPHDFYCLLAARQVLPFTTDIPFNMNAGFVDRAAEWLRRVAGPTATPPPATPAEPPPAEPPPAVVPAAVAGLE